MNQNFLALTAAGIIFILVFSGCVGEESGPESAGGLSAEEVRDRSVEALGGVESYSFDLDAGFSMGEGVEDVAAMVLSGGGRIDLEGKRMYTKMNVAMLDASVSTETYIIDDVMYTLSPLLGWVKQEAGVDVWTAHSVAAQKELMEDVEVSLLGDEVVDGVDCFILGLNPDRESVVRLLGRQMGGSSGVSAAEVGESIRSMEVKEWVDKDSFLVRRSVVFLEMESEGRVMEGTVSMDFYDYNRPVTIELPEEAVNARSMRDLMEAGDLTGNQ